jgi:uncharacterized membrane protein YfcA
VNVKTGLALAFYLTLVATLLNIVWGLMVAKEINWIISLVMGFGVFCGAIIGFRHISKKGKGESIIQTANR